MTSTNTIAMPPWAAICVAVLVIALVAVNVVAARGLARARRADRELLS